MGDTFNAYVEDLTKLSKLLELCKEQDPQGIYSIEWEPLFDDEGNINYKIENHPHGVIDIFDRYPSLLPLKAKSSNVKIFKSLHIMPSAITHFWKCSRKMISADAAHLKGQFDGIINILTGRDAHERNVSMMFSICSSENKLNWENTIGEFLSKAGSDAELFISDRDKGLECAKETYGNQMKDCVFAACSLHIAKNVGITNEDGKSLVTKLAKAPSQEAFDDYSTKLKTLVGTDKHNKLLELKNSFTFMGLKEEYATMITNYGICNNNASEQQNNKHRELRDLPYTRATLHFINELNEMFTNRKEEAIVLQQKHVAIVPAIADKVRKSIKHMKTKHWRVVLCNTSYKQTDGTLDSATFHLRRKGEGSVAVQSQFIVSFFPFKKLWYERIQCKCNYHKLHGYPCFHSAYILVHLDKIHCSIQTKKRTAALKAIIHSPMWKYNSVKWYSHVFSVANLVAQYSAPVLCNIDVNLLTIEQHLLLPPDAKRRRGRKKKKRYVSKPKQNDTNVIEMSSSSSDELSDQESEHMESDGDNIGEVASEASSHDLQMLEEARSDYLSNEKPNVGGISRNTCSHCGQKGHNCFTCDKRDILYMLSKCRYLRHLTQLPTELSSSSVVDVLLGAPATTEVIQNNETFPSNSSISSSTSAQSAVETLLIEDADDEQEDDCESTSVGSKRKNKSSYSSNKPRKRNNNKRQPLRSYVVRSDKL